MQTLRGVFPEPKREVKRNFIKENVKQLQFIQKTKPQDVGNSKNVFHKVSRKSSANVPELLSSVSKLPQTSTMETVSVQSRTQNRVTQQAPVIKLRKGDMSEFLKRKELRKVKNIGKNSEKSLDCDDGSGIQYRDIGCQTVDTSGSHLLADGAKLSVVYPKVAKENQKDTANNCTKASGDSCKDKPISPNIISSRYKNGIVNSVEEDESGLMRLQRSRYEEEQEERAARDCEAAAGKPSTLRPDKDPYVPATYQKGVIPLYLRTRKQRSAADAASAPDASCPPAHARLPDAERKDTLRMLRSSFAELVTELNKLPVRTDTLRMRNKKMELEKQLEKLDEGIKIFSRPKVYVKIGE